MNDKYIVKLACLRSKLAEIVLEAVTVDSGAIHSNGLSFGVFYITKEYEVSSGEQATITNVAGSCVHCIHNFKVINGSIDRYLHDTGAVELDAVVFSIANILFDSNACSIMLCSDQHRSDLSLGNIVLITYAIDEVYVGFNDNNKAITYSNISCGIRNFYSVIAHNKRCRCINLNTVTVIEHFGFTIIISDFQHNVFGIKLIADLILGLILACYNCCTSRKNRSYLKGCGYGLAVFGVRNGNVVLFSLGVIKSAESKAFGKFLASFVVVGYLNL